MGPIKFVKTERVCPYNTEIREKRERGVETNQLVYDYHVIQDGQLLAMFKPFIVGYRHWVLSDIDGEDLRHPKDRYLLKAKKKADFLEVFTKYFEMGAIPTRASLDEKRRNAERVVRKQHDAQMKAQRAEKIKEGAPRLMSLLKDLLAEYNTSSPLTVEAARVITELES